VGIFAWMPCAANSAKWMETQIMDGQTGKGVAHEHRDSAPRTVSGYWVVTVAFLCNFIQSGCGFFAFSLFVKPLEADLGWSRGGIMTAFTIAFLITGAAAPFAGQFVDRYGARLVISLGAAITGMGFALLSFVNRLGFFYIAYALVGVGLAAAGPVSASAIVSKWFQQRRGLVIGLMSSGIGMGGLVLAPFIGGYLIPNFGWRISYRALAFLAWLCIIPLTLWVLKAEPKAMHTGADESAHDDIGPTATPPSALKGPALSIALSTSAFWLIALSFFFSQFSQAGILQNQTPYLQDIGFPITVTANALGLIGLMSVISKLGFGLLCDWIAAKYACAIGFGLQLVGIVLLMALTPTSPPVMLWLYVVIIGLGGGSWLPTMSMVVSSNFGVAHYGVIFGVVSLIERIGVSTGPLLAGYTHDWMHSYSLAFTIFLAAYGVSIPAILLIRRSIPSPAPNGV
jgi:MFS family permease